MTLAALLEELKEVDAKAYEEYFKLVERTRYDFWPVWVADPITGEYSPESGIIFNSIIQASIQRACERRGWEIEQNYRTRGRDGDLPKNMRHYAVVTSWYNDVHTYRGMGGTSASALLAAYVAAAKEEKQ